MAHTIPLPVKAALDAYAARLRDHFGDRLREIRLFGSYARGDAAEDSDVDVLVVIDALTDLEIGIAAGAAAPVIVAYRLPLAPLPLSTEKLAAMRRSGRALAQDLDREGIPL